MTASSWGNSTFVPGPHDALAGPTAIGIVEQAQPSTRSRLWSLIANEATLDDVLDELSSEGLKSLPSFALAHFEDGSIRVVARGSARAAVIHLDGTEHVVDATGVRTWTEELFDSVATVVLSIDIPADDDRRDEAATDELALDQYFVLAGAVPAISIRREFATDHRLAERARSEWVRPAHPSTDRTESESVPGPAPAADPVAAAVSAFSEQDPEPVPDPGVTPAPERPPIAVATPTEKPHGPFDALDLDLPAATDNPRLISSVPISTVPGVSVTPSKFADEAPGNDAPRTDDGDNLTISRAELARRRQLHDSGPLPGPGQVRSILCGAGHPNPPHQVACRMCGSTVPDGAPVIVDRPPLGILVFSNGERIVVDRSVIIGRNPKVTETSGGELPRIARFDDSTLGLSRSHAQVVVEGWQMFVEDLDSRNGTDVTLPGRSRQRLRSGEPVMLEAGAIVHLDDDDLTCTIEAFS